jgi:hypothetical protein
MAKKTIKLKKYIDIIVEGKAHEAITPGMLISLRSTGKFQKHPTAGGSVLPMFALEDELQGKGITDAYAEDAPVQAWIPNRGEEVLALLKDGQNVVIGDLLESAGTGELQKHVADTADSDDAITVINNQIVGIALEAVDLSDSSGADPSARIAIRII